MNMKYELVKTGGPGTSLYRIKALREIPLCGISVGDLGGFVSGEHNLSQYGDCWIFGEAIVSEKAVVSEMARVSGKAVVAGGARIFGYAQVFGEARIFGESRIFGEARVFGESKVFGQAHVSGKAKVFDDALVFGEARLFGESEVFGHSRVSGEVRVSGKAKVFEGAQVFGKAKVFGEAVCSVSPISIGGLCPEITICDNVVIVGCQNLTIPEWEDWETHCREDQELYLEIKDFIIPIAKYHQNELKERL